MDTTALGRIETLGLDQEDSPAALTEAFQKAERYRRQWFVNTVLSLRQSFCNYGFAIKARRREDADALKAWMEKSDEKLEPIQDYVDELWHEWLTFSNAISFWRDRAPRPILLELKDVKYSDLFGSEVLKIRHYLTSEQIDKLRGWSAAEKARIKKDPMLEVRPDDDQFHFKVAKRAKMGKGLGFPQLKGLFESLSFSESLEVGDSLRGFLCRKVYEQHKFGHEIKGGNKAGAPDHFFKKPKGDAWSKFIKGKTGVVSFSGNFDHEISYPGQDPKLFEAKRYESAINRMLWWSAPIGQMIMARGVTPYLMDLLHQQCAFERQKIERHLATTLNEVFNFPVRVRVQWSNRCFKDTRLATELLKFGLQNGPLSQTTYIEEAGGDPEVERSRKSEEASLPKSQTLPLFDSAHGQEPGKGKAPTGSPGRKQGTPDP